MKIPAHVASFWQSFAQTRAEDPTPRFFESFHFDDNQRSADELARLVLARAYFGRECQRIGRVRDPGMPVVCERFEVVFDAGCRP
jgi:uncharacterized protein YhfF